MVDFAAVKRFYFEHHVKKRVRDKIGPRRAFACLLEYLVVADVEPKVAAFTLARQVGLMKWLAVHHALSNKTISTYLSYIKTGVRFCSRPGLVKDARGQEREVRLLSRPPHIDDSEERVARKPSYRNRSRATGRPPSGNSPPCSMPARAGSGR